MSLRFATPLETSQRRILSFRRGTLRAIELAASQRKIKLPADLSVDAEIDLNLADGAYFLAARLNVSVPGLDREVAQELLHAAHGICPCSKPTRRNSAAPTNLV